MSIFAENFNVAQCIPIVIAVLYAFILWLLFSK